MTQLLSTTPRRLVVNADDFGFSTGINRGVIRGHERGIITSASLMVRQPAAPAAGEYARANSELGVGLHVDLGEWVYSEGEWRVRYSVVPVEDEVAIEAEVGRQLSRFRALVGRDPGHLDSHQHVHRTEPVRQVMLRLARRLGVPLRGTDRGIPYCGQFYGQSERGSSCAAVVSASALVRLLEALPAGDTELACHPARKADFESAYRGERLLELRALCDPTVRQTVAAERIELCRFSDL
jgi:predicted glycoside hydrolase/deacetylase ChbG (UPF0249 family)